MTSTVQFNTSVLLRNMLIGAVPGLILISLFISGTGEPNPEWGPYWYLRPLVIVPMAGAMGGAFFYLADHMASKNGWNKAIITAGSCLVYIVGLWLGTVLGLAGTYWN